MATAPHGETAIRAHLSSQQPVDSNTACVNRQPPYCTAPLNNSSAIIYCEGNFGGVDGKTANGLVRHSEKYKILSIVDSEKAGLDSGQLLNGVKNNVPIYADLLSAYSQSIVLPQYLIYGCAPASGRLSVKERSVLLHAILSDGSLSKEAWNSSNRCAGKFVDLFRCYVSCSFP